MSLHLGAVVATYPKGNSVDVLLNKDGTRLPNVQVMSYSASSNTGMMDLPDIGAAAGDARWDITGPVTRYIRAIIDYVDGVPICIGFLLPSITQLTFDRKNFKVDRHASDVYSTINDKGDIEIYHPSGSYFRLAATTAHEDLTGLDFDKEWAEKNNTGTSVHAHFVIANAGSVVAVVDIDPSGNAILTNNGNVTVTNGGNTVLNTTGNLTATIGGTSSINSTGAMEFTAPSITFNGPVIGSSTITAPNLIGTTNVTFGGKSGITHQHSDPQGGNTGAPI
jgi:hypothetical protein